MVFYCLNWLDLFITVVDNKKDLRSDGEDNKGS